MTDTHTEAERVARSIHDARYGNDYPNALIRTWEQEDVAGKEYCRRLARAAIEALPARNDERALKLVEALRDLVTTLDAVLPPDDFYYEREKARAALEQTI